MKFAFIMDPYETLNLETETSLLIMKELLSRGHEVYWLEPDDLYLDHHILKARAAIVERTSPFLRQASHEVLLDDFDALLTRIDPPFDSNFLHLSYLLEHVSESVVQFNPAAALRNFNEKLLPLKWPEFVAPSVVTQNASAIIEFLNRHGEIVLKPLDDCSGRGILKLSKTQHGAEALIHNALEADQGHTRMLQAQRFLPAVSQGDKRVYLVNGEAIGSVNRLPSEGNFLANIHQGASCEASQLTPREQHIIQSIKPFLAEQGIFLAGLDFIDGFITEINITSPSAVRQINAVSGRQLEKDIVDAMLVRLKPAERRIRLACCGKQLLSA